MAANLTIRIVELGPESRSKASEITLRPIGPITAATSAALERTLRDLIPKFERIVLDLTNVEHIDHCGLRALLRVYLQAEKANCDLRMDNPKPRLRHYLWKWLNSVLEGHEEYLGITPD